MARRRWGSWEGRTGSQQDGSRDPKEERPCDGSCDVAPLAGSARGVGALTVVAVALFACAPPPKASMTPTYDAQKEAISAISVQPKASQPPVVGAFDFEIVGDADGKGCFDRNESAHALGYVPYVNRTGEMLPTLANYAVSTAIYDALTKVKDADTILVTWTRTETTGDKSCAEIHGKAIRLTKAKPKEEVAAPPPVVINQPPPVVQPPPPPPPPPPSATVDPFPAPPPAKPEKNEKKKKPF